MSFPRKNYLHYYYWFSHILSYGQEAYRNLRNTSVEILCNLYRLVCFVFIWAYFHTEIAESFEEQENSLDKECSTLYSGKRLEERCFVGGVVLFYLVARANPIDKQENPAPTVLVSHSDGVWEEGI